jgi:acyl-CoA reductase-like NAD-dependent aldehyde dehydrogenase
MSDAHLNLIDGTWMPGDHLTENRNPSDLSDLVGHYAAATAGDVDRAVQAARAALPAWQAKGPLARADLLDRVARRIEAEAEEIGRMLAREEGKILSEAIAETRRAAQIFRFFGGEALRIPGEALASVRPGVDIEVTREPIGVIGLITPWNFPAAIPAWKLAPALAFGNAVLLKPAEMVPGTAHLLARIIHEEGCPPGIFNLVMGPGSVVGRAMVAHPDIAAISFTGSAQTGRMIARHAPELPIKLVRSGPLGGDRQITRMIYRGHIDAVIFLVDASQRHPHQRDINRLVAAAQATQIPRAFDAEGAGLLLSDVDLFPARAPGPAAGIARWSGVERAPTSPRRPPPTCWRGA